MNPMFLMYYDIFLVIPAKAEIQEGQGSSSCPGPPLPLRIRSGEVGAGRPHHERLDEFEELRDGYRLCHVAVAPALANRRFVAAQRVRRRRDDRDPACVRVPLE